MNGETKMDMSQPEPTGNVGIIQSMLKAGHRTSSSHQSSDGSRTEAEKLTRVEITLEIAKN